MNLTLAQFKQVIPGNKNVEHWYHDLDQLLPDYDINTPARIAHFLAQCHHESGGFLFLAENLNYKASGLRKTFPKYFPDDTTAQKYEKRGDAIANHVYANRMGNGDEASGDGARYKGRGLIQVTGKDNYFWFAASVNLTPEEASEYMQTFEGAAQSACWFWENNGLNKFADANDIITLTKRINGGDKGLDDRKAQYARISRILGA